MNEDIIIEISEFVDFDALDTNLDVMCKLERDTPVVQATTDSITFIDEGQPIMNLECDDTNGIVFGQPTVVKKEVLA